MTWEMRFFGPRIEGFDPPISWVDWAQLGATYLLLALAVAFIAWALIVAIHDERRATAARNAQIQRFSDMLAEIRLMLSIWARRDTRS